MTRVLVLNAQCEPLMPCTPAWARRLLSRGRPAVWRRVPFTIRLLRPVEEAKLQPFRLKLDPSSRTTGLALVNDTSGQVVFAAEITHRGQQVKDALYTRRAVRRSRRACKTRYRQARFLNRRRPKGWLPPFLESRLANVTTWVARLRRLCPIGAISLELVKFDLALLQEPSMTGLAYQQGTLAGYEVREYVLEKWGRRCAYCHQPSCQFEIDHILPRSRGGSNRPSNLALACHACNQEKGDRTAEEYGHPDVQAQAKLPLKDAAAVNATRWALYGLLKATRLPVEVGSGGLTKFNRTTRGLPKTHWLDALCVGTSTPVVLRVERTVPLLIQATGRGSRQQCRMDASGFPCTGPKAARTVKGFRTGDLVRAVVRTGKKHGTYVGRVAVRATGSFNITTPTGTVQGISFRTCTLLQRADGYRYEKGMALPPQA